MKILGVKNLIAKFLIFTLVIYFHAGAETMRCDFKDAEDTCEEQPYWNALQENYETEVVKITQFFDTTSGNFLKMMERMDKMENMVKEGLAEFKTAIASDLIPRFATLEREGTRRDRELRADFASVSAEFFPLVAFRNPFRISTDCGGNLELARGAPSTIRFPNSGNNQTCVWSIIPQEKPFASHRVKFHSLGTETEVVGVTVHYLVTSSALKSQTVTKFGLWIPIPASFVIISFCSDLSKVSSGFEASIVGIGTSVDGADLKPSWFGNPTETLDVFVQEIFVDPIAVKTPLVKSTDCGGILNVARGVPTTIRYPNGGNYREWENCAWSISPKSNFASYRVKIQSFGMEENCDGVKIYFWGANLEFQSVKITEFDSWISIPAPHVVITFGSDDDTEGGGFGASIVGVGSSSDSSTFTPFWLTNPSGSFSYPPDTSSTGSNNEMVSVVVQYSNPRPTIVSVSVPRIGSDTIKSYHLRCQHSLSPNFLLFEGSEGGNSSWATYQSDWNPSLVIFKSNARKSGVRFTISY